MDKALLELTINRLDELKDNLSNIYAEVAALKETINHFNSEKEDNEEPTIEDEIMSCLKELINNNDLFKDVKIKIVKVDEDDE